MNELLSKAQVVDVLDTLATDRVQAIKLLRNYTGSSLGVAKTIIDKTWPIGLLTATPSRSLQFSRLLAAVNDYGLHDDVEITDDKQASLPLMDVMSIIATNDLLRGILIAVRETNDLLKDLAFERGD